MSSISPSMALEYAMKARKYFSQAKNMAQKVACDPNTRPILIELVQTQRDLLVKLKNELCSNNEPTIMYKNIVTIFKNQTGFPSAIRMYMGANQIKLQPVINQISSQVKQSNICTSNINSIFIIY